MRRSTFVLCAAALIELAAGAAWADEWSVESNVTAKATYTDNLDLLPNVTNPAEIYTISPSARFSNRTEAHELGAELRVDVNRYPGKPQLNTVGYALNGLGRWLDERNTYGLTLTAVRDTTLESELSTTGVVQKRAQRTLVGASPYWWYSLSERLQAKLDYRYSQVFYEPGSGLIDYITQGAKAGLQQQLSERASIGASVSFGYFWTSASNTGVETVSANADYDATERLKLSAELGAQRTRTETRQQFLVCPLTGFINDPICAFFGVDLEQVTATQRTDDHAWVGRLLATYLLEAGSFNFAVIRDLNPTGNGLLVRTDHLVLGYKKTLQERLSLNADYTALYSVYLGGAYNRVYYQKAALGMRWQADPYLALGTGYARTEQHNSAQSGTAHANEIFVNLVYTWPKVSVSR